MTPFAYVVPARWRVPLFSALICLTVSMLLAAGKVAIHGGFGAADLIPFFLWTIPLSLIVGFTKSNLIVILRARPLILVGALSVTIGIVAGLSWTYFVAFWLGPYFSAFSFAVLTCWLVGASSGLLGTSSYHRDRGESVATSFAIVIMLSAIGLTVERQAFRLWMSPQELEVVSVKWKPGPQPLSNPPVVGHKLSDTELDLLKSIGLTGQVELASSGTFGNGKHSKAIIVVTEPLSQPAALPQPDGGQVVYLQTPEGWKMYPQNASTLKRNIQLTLDGRDPNKATQYYVENANGTRQGSTLLTW